MISEDDELDRDARQRIVSAGHSRLPVHKSGDPTTFIGVLIVKELVHVQESTKVKDLQLRTPMFLDIHTPMYFALNEFQKGRAHLALIVRKRDATTLVNDYEQQKESLSTESHSEVVGLITLEDVLEELLQEEISDETDAAEGMQTYPRRSSLLAMPSRRTIARSATMQSTGSKRTLASAEQARTLDGDNHNDRARSLEEGSSMRTPLMQGSGEGRAG